MAASPHKSKDEVKRAILTHLETRNSLSKSTKEETLQETYDCTSALGFDTSCAQGKRVSQHHEVSTISTLIQRLESESKMVIKAFAIPTSYAQSYLRAYDYIIQDSDDSIVVRIAQAPDRSKGLIKLVVFIEIERKQVEDQVEFKIVGLTLPSDVREIHGAKREQAVKFVRQFTTAFYDMQ